LSGKRTLIQAEWQNESGNNFTKCEKVIIVLNAHKRRIQLQISKPLPAFCIILLKRMNYSFIRIIYEYSEQVIYNGITYKGCGVKMGVL
jgi:hypothetical protein